MTKPQLDLTHIRREYESKPLLESEVDKDPIAQFVVWFNEWLSVNPLEPTAMVLSSVDEKGIPDSRVVLLKEIWEQKFVFFTNYLSHKSSQILLNPHVALNFYWPELSRQVRIRGRAFKIPESMSEQYFLERPFESQCAAIASPQSHKLASREKLEELYHLSLHKYEHKQMIRPEYWGGFAVMGFHFEFWQGRTQRLHDRIVYKKDGNDWHIIRLAP
jgi:pyridoxamine 5'-phosphate oxidase